VVLEPLDLSSPRHLAELADALSGAPYAGAPGFDAAALVWMYMRGAAVEMVRVPREATDEYFRRVDGAPDSRMFIIRDRASGLVAGATALLANRPRDLAVEIGAITISPPFQGTAVNTEATWLLLEWAFSAGYRRLEWKCNSANARSMAAAQRLGFTFEGVFRRWVGARTFVITVTPARQAQQLPQQQQSPPLPVPRPQPHDRAGALPRHRLVLHVAA